MMGWFRRLLPREDRFFDLFAQHSETLVQGSKALEQLLAGGDIEALGNEITSLEERADAITREVLLAVRRSFITPFDRGDIKDLIMSMDDAIDMMHKTVKTVTLVRAAQLRTAHAARWVTAIVEAATLTAQAVPLLNACERQRSTAERTDGGNHAASKNAPTNCTTGA